MASRAFTTRFMITCSICAGSAFTLPTIVRDAGDHLNVVVHQAAQQLVHIEDDGVQVQRFGLQHLFAAESEQLAHQRGRAAGGIFDALDIVREFRAERWGG